jgi:hypothetical protein
VIENLKAEMGHPDVIEVGKGQGDVQVDPVVVLANDIGFYAKVTAGMRDSAQDVLSG